MPPVTPSQNPIKPQASPKGPRWNQLQARATTAASITALFVFLIVIGVAVGYFYAKSKQPAPKTNTPSITNLTPAELSRLSQVGSTLGSNGQNLNIGADTIFRGKIDVGGDLSVGGHFNANGPVTLSELNISGTTALTGLNVGSNLTVAGLATFQKSLSVTGLAAVNGNLSVTGATSVNALNASSIAVNTLTISGPLLISHLQTQGAAPGAVAGAAVGAGGTVSLSGNDTTGTLNFNTGGSTAAGVLGTITFRAAYSSTVHVMLTPLTGAAASTPAYITRTTSGFQVHTDSPAPTGSALNYDYLVAQ